MLPPPFTNALVLTGPTASGKTGLAIELAQRLEAEIISMDSMTLYRHMDVGTAKPTAEQRRIVPHHLIDVLEPTESASVAWWLEQATTCCLEIEGRGKQVLFVGGTPLYLKALMFGLFEGPAADLELRHRLAEEARLVGSAVLHERLAGIDPLAAGRIHPNDLRRIIRALEVFELTGQAISSWQKQWHRDKERASRVSERASRVSERASRVSGGSPSDDSGSLPPLTREARSPMPTSIWLDWPRTELYERINQRVVAMFDAGLVEEALALRRFGPLSKEASQAVGFAEAFALIDGLCTREQAIDRIQTRTRQFAKHQVTWFRHLPDCLSATSELTWKLWQTKMRWK
jgi:tRNA dimethylallyltransferase